MAKFWKSLMCGIPATGKCRHRSLAQMNIMLSATTGRCLKGIIPKGSQRARRLWVKFFYEAMGVAGTDGFGAAGAGRVALDLPVPQRGTCYPQTSGRAVQVCLD